MQQGEWTLRTDRDSLEEIKFSSKFDSGNCKRVEYISPWKYTIWVATDCEGTEWACASKTWFYFSVSDVPQGREIKFTVTNMGNQKLMYFRGMKPVFSYDRISWSRIPGAVRFEEVVATNSKTKEKAKSGKIVFKYEFTEAKTVYFAFCYPYSYEQCQSKLQLLEQQFKPSTDTTSDTIYFHRDCLVKSVQGRNVDILTITNMNTSSINEYETMNWGDYNGLFPDSETREGCLFFPGKPIIFLTCRVHPGETPSQYMFDGTLDFLLDLHDDRARRLRELFVFKLVPMLNPDGVAMGNYRCDSYGVNLNRVYENPTLERHPSIYAVKTALLAFAKVETVEFYIDYHAHATKRGCFIIGNYVEAIEEQANVAAFARVLAINTPFFDFDACDFSMANMTRKDKRDQNQTTEGSARVAVHRASNIHGCYTLESNYNTGKQGEDAATQLRQITGTSGFSIPQSRVATRGSVRRRPVDSIGARNSATPPLQYFYFDPEKWTAIGRAVCVSMLDIVGQNPSSVLGSNLAETLEKVKLATGDALQARRERSALAKAKRLAAAQTAANDKPDDSDDS